MKYEGAYVTWTTLLHMQAGMREESFNVVYVSRVAYIISMFVFKNDEAAPKQPYIDFTAQIAFE